MTDTFNHNTNTGLFVNSLGDITIANAQADANLGTPNGGGYGAQLSNAQTCSYLTQISGTVCMYVTGSGSVSVQNVLARENYRSGLLVNSTKAVSVDAVHAHGNGLVYFNPACVGCGSPGANIYNYMADPNSPAPVTVRDSTFNGNTTQGLSLGSLGDIVLTNVQANGNAIYSGNTMVSGRGYGAYLFNGAVCLTTDCTSMVTGTGSVTVTNGTFNGNYSNGLQVDSTGVVQLINVTANNNGFGTPALPGSGATVQTRSGSITVDPSTFNGNAGYGLFAATDNGTITLSNVTATGNISNTLLQGNLADPTRVAAVLIGTPANDVITFDGAATLLNATRVTLASILNLTLAGSAGDDTVNVTPSIVVTVTVDGGPNGRTGDMLNVYGMGLIVTKTLTVFYVEGRRPVFYAGIETAYAAMPGLSATQQKTFDDAMLHLVRANDPSLWRDATHFNPTTGGAVFDEQRIATQDLLSLINDKKHPEFKSMLQPYIDRMMQTDDLIVSTAIGDLRTAGVDTKKINQVVSIYNAAKNYVSGANYLKAIDSFKSAWTLAMGALKNYYPPLTLPAALDSPSSNSPAASTAVALTTVPSAPPVSPNPASTSTANPASTPSTALNSASTSTANPASAPPSSGTAAAEAIPTSTAATSATPQATSAGNVATPTADASAAPKSMGAPSAAAIPAVSAAASEAAPRVTPEPAVVQAPCLASGSTRDASRAADDDRSSGRVQASPHPATVDMLPVSLSRDGALDSLWVDASYRDWSDLGWDWQLKTVCAQASADGSFLHRQPTYYWLALTTVLPATAYSVPFSSTSCVIPSAVAGKLASVHVFPPSRLSITPSGNSRAALVPMYVPRAT